MKKFTQKSLALLLAFVLIFSLLPAVSLTANAATVTYRYSSNGYIYNWGTRGEVATFLSPNAEIFYEKYDVTLESLSALSGSSTYSQIPSSALYIKLSKMMSDAHDYITSYDATKNLFQYTDCQGSGLTNSKISSFYSGVGIGPAWNGEWNREHTWPNSKGDMSGSGENDLMMLRPTASIENSSRGNKAYGQSSGYYNPNNESGGKLDLRGDVARIILYTFVRWKCTNTGSKYDPTDIFGTGGVFESQEVLLDWIEIDPVDTWELGRNDSVESITGTRNVFVDYPELAFLLFEEQVPAMQTPSGSGGGQAPDAGVTIDTQPASVTVNEGETATFTVAATGEELTYQWQYRTSTTDTWKNSPATGNKTATLSVPGTAMRNGYQYRCAVTSAGGKTVYTNAATLKLHTVFVLTQPVDATMQEGLTAQFTVVADGEGLTYQWYYRTSATDTWKASPAAGNKTATLSVPVTISRNGYQYYCKITDTAGDTVSTDTVTLTVTQAEPVTPSWSYEITDGEVTITDCDESASGELVIPDTIEGYPVTVIGNSAFKDCSSLTSVTIPDGVTRIEFAAFDGCSSLTGIAIPNGVISIGGSAFSNCSSLTDVIIPDSVSSIAERYTFANCSSLTTVIIGNNVTSIGDYTFYNCSSLTGISIPDSVTNIGGFAFYDCNNMTSATIGNGVANIGPDAFHGCSSLTEITIPESVINIDIHAFGGDHNIKTVYYGGTEAQWAELTNKPDCDKVVYYNLDGWVDVNGAWCYYVDGQKATNAWVQDSAGWYYMGADGYAVKNTWVMNENGWMYIGSNKHPVTNAWAQDSAGWYYMGADGYAVKNAWTEDSSGLYYMDSTGRAVKNTWVMNEGGWMYIGSNKHPVTNNWAQDSAGWYFMGADGYAVKNAWTKDSTGWYYMDSTGRAVKNGWAKDSGGWLYMGADGHAVKNQWITVDGKTYYADASGHIK